MALGFTSLYREGVEVVLFLQSYRMKLGARPVAWGVAIGLLLTSAVAILTFVLHRRLPYRRMLVFTGILLGVVLLVMVGEQAQEMQLAGWLPTHEIPWLSRRIPGWMGLWLSVFPTVETLIAQVLALVLVARLLLRRAEAACRTGCRGFSGRTAHCCRLASRAPEYAATHRRHNAFRTHNL